MSDSEAILSELLTLPRVDVLAWEDSSETYQTPGNTYVRVEDIEKLVKHFQEDKPEPVSKQKMTHRLRKTVEKQMRTDSVLGVVSYDIQDSFVQVRYAHGSFRSAANYSFRNLETSLDTPDILDHQVKRMVIAWKRSTKNLLLKEEQQ